MDRTELLRLCQDLKRGSRDLRVLNLCDAVEVYLRQATVAAKQQSIKYVSGPTQAMKKRVGRPPLGERPLTASERVKRWREKRRKEGK